MNVNDVRECENEQVDAVSIIVVVVTIIIVMLAKVAHHSSLFSRALGLGPSV